MQRTGEREVPDKPGTLEGIDIKHTERYEWASSYTHNKQVYDIACGVGYGSHLLGASSYVGFDNNLETIDYATKYYATQNSISFSLADACSMPQTLTVADVIVSFETIEHIKYPDKFLSWCTTHTKLLLISSPIRHSFKRSRFHLFEYKLSEFEEVLKKHFNKISTFIQKNDAEIVYPCQANDKGVAVAVCQN